MKIYTLYILVFLLFSCSKKADADSEIVAVKNNDTLPSIAVDSLQHYETDWQDGFHLTHNSAIDSIDGKPVKFYIQNKNCDSLAIAFYYGKYRPSDDHFITNLLALSSTNDNNLRPFYRWILDKTIEISDGALGEYPGVPARKYAEKFPSEFFKFMDADSTKERYVNWTEIISYSGFYEHDDYKNPKLIRKQLETVMLKNSSLELKNRITKFTLDCFPDVSKQDQ